MGVALVVCPRPPAQNVALTRGAKSLTPNAGNMTGDTLEIPRPLQSQVPRSKLLMQASTRPSLTSPDKLLHERLHVANHSPRPMLESWPNRLEVDRARGPVSRAGVVWHKRIRAVGEDIEGRGAKNEGREDRRQRRLRIHHGG